MRSGERCGRRGAGFTPSLPRPLRGRLAGLAVLAAVRWSGAPLVCRWAASRARGTGTDRPVVVVQAQRGAGCVPEVYPRGCDQCKR